MKQAILITAYKDFCQLKKLVQEFDSSFNIYIHVDKKSVFTASIKKDLINISNVHYVSQDYKVNWGGLNHLKSYLKLCDIALENKDNGYFHLITGQDFPIQSNNYFKKLSKEGKNYLSSFKMPASGWKGGGMDRVEQYNLYDIFDAKKSDKWIYLFKRLQLRIKFKRNIDTSLGQLYGGNTYWSLTREALQYVITYTNEHPKFFKRFKFTFCAEEIYFQTILMNSELRERITNSDLRYIDWITGRGGHPAFLDETDFENIISSKKLFARKLNYERNSLFEKLSNYRKA